MEISSHKELHTELMANEKQKSDFDIYLFIAR